MHVITPDPLPPQALKSGPIVPETSRDTSPHSHVQSMLTPREPIDQSEDGAGSHHARHAVRSCSVQDGLIRGRVVWCFPVRVALDGDTRYCVPVQWGEARKLGTAPPPQAHQRHLATFENFDVSKVPEANVACATQRCRDGNQRRDRRDAALGQHFHRPNHSQSGQQDATAAPIQTRTGRRNSTTGQRVALQCVCTLSATADVDLRTGEQQRSVPLNISCAKGVTLVERFVTQHVTHPMWI